MLKNKDVYTPQKGSLGIWWSVVKQSIRAFSCLLPTLLVKKPLSRGQSAGNLLFMQEPCNQGPKALGVQSTQGCKAPLGVLLSTQGPKALGVQSTQGKVQVAQHRPSFHFFSFDKTMVSNQNLLRSASKLLSHSLFDGKLVARPTFQEKNKEWMWGSSETGRRNLSNTSISCYRKYSVSIHRPKPRLPQKSSDFGSFLAGLIDSNGHFNKIPHLVICFHKNNIKLGYFLKKSLGFGTVNKIKQKAAYRYVLSHKLGLKKVVVLLQEKLRHPDKIQQYNERLIEKGIFDLDSEYSHLNHISRLTQAYYKKSDLNPFWLTGFVAGDGSFQIKFVNSATKKSEEIRLVIQIDQKEVSVLKYIAHHLGGSIGYRKKQETYYYSSVSFSNAAKWIQILDQTHLIGSKMTQYVLWRRAFILIQQGKHLDPHIRKTTFRRLKEAIDRLKH